MLKSTHQEEVVKSMSKIAPAHIPWWERTFWWAVTIATLILIDDLAFGPIFWLLSLILNHSVVTLLSFAISFTVQLWVIRAGTDEQPKKWATKIITRLFGSRKKPQVTERETSLHNKATSAVGAVLVSVVIGGVVPIFVLHRSGMRDRVYLRRLAVVTSLVYAVEFALIHGGYGFGALLSWLV